MQDSQLKSNWNKN